MARLAEEADLLRKRRETRTRRRGRKNARRRRRNARAETSPTPRGARVAASRVSAAETAAEEARANAADAERRVEEVTRTSRVAIEEAERLAAEARREAGREAEKKRLCAKSGVRTRRRERRRARETRRGTRGDASTSRPSRDADTPSGVRDAVARRGRVAGRIAGRIATPPPRTIRRRRTTRTTRWAWNRSRRSCWANRIRATFPRRTPPLSRAPTRNADSTTRRVARFARRRRSPRRDANWSRSGPRR